MTERLPSEAHDWDQRLGYCRKCHLTFVEYYGDGRPVCGQRKVVSLLASSDLQRLEADLRARGLL